MSGLGQVDIDRSLFSFAASVAVDAYGELKTTGRVSEPGLAGAALVQLKALVAELESGGVEPFAEDEDASALVEGSVEHLRRGCTCQWCPHGTEAS